MHGTPATLRHEAPELAYELHRRAPHPALAGLVRGMAGFWERSAGPVRRRELPSGDAVVILDLDAGWEVAGEHAPVRLGSFASGLSAGPAFAGHDGRATCLQLDLTPAGVRALLGVPAGELAGRAVELDALLGDEARRLVERLADAPTWAARFAELEAALLARAAQAPPPWPDVAYAERRLRETAGRLPVEALARELGCSRRHLARRFARDVGLTPKTFARVQRFRRAAALLREPAGPSLAAIAHACGYVDQAHLTREARALAGVTPSALRAAALPGGGGVAAVPSVQDRAVVAA